MNIWGWVFGGGNAPTSSDNNLARAPMDMNPATGLPMLGDCGRVDVGGNPFGMDLRQTGDHSSPDFGSGFDTGASLGTGWPD